MISLEQALQLARTVETVANSCGHYTALAGSCMYRGYSENDVDMVVYPHRGKEKSTEETYLAIAEALNAKSHFQVNHEKPSHLVIRIVLDGLNLDLFFIHENPSRFKTQEQLAIAIASYEQLQQAV